MGRIVVSNLHKQTSESFVDVIKLLHSHVEPKTKQPSPLISNELYNDVMDNKEKLNAAIKYDRDYKYDYFRFKTLEKSYLLSIDKKIIERPQHLIMRVALGIHGKDINTAIETYDLMSSHFFIHATVNKILNNNNKHCIIIKYKCYYNYSPLYIMPELVVHNCLIVF